MPAPSLEEADAFLSMMLYSDGWTANSPTKKQQAINSAQALLKSIYSGASMANDYVYYQAAYMLSSPYNAVTSHVSSQSVSSSGVSQSFASGTRIEKRDILAPEVLFGLGEPTKSTAPITIGRLY
jgi:hypothetical protein